MIEPQVSSIDPVDHLVPPPSGRARLVLLLAGVFVVLSLAAVAPMSGAVRPNLAFAGTENGSAIRGAGDWEYLVTNRGWTTAAIERFDLGLEGVDVVETSFNAAAKTLQGLPSEPLSHGPLAVGSALVGDIVIAPGEGVVVHVRFRYDCARRSTTQRSTVRARGVTPLWFNVDMGAGTYPGAPSGLAKLVDFACDHPS